MAVKDQFNRALKNADNNQPCSERQGKVVAGFFGKIVRKRDKRLELESQIFGRKLGSTYDLTRGEACALIDFAFVGEWEIDSMFFEWVYTEYLRMVADEETVSDGW